MIEPTDKVWGVSKTFVIFMVWLAVITIASFIVGAWFDC